MKKRITNLLCNFLLMNNTDCHSAGIFFRAGDDFAAFIGSFATRCKIPSEGQLPYFNIDLGFTLPCKKCFPFYKIPIT